MYTQNKKTLYLPKPHKAVETVDNETQARLLQFVTGTSKVLINGFSELQDNSSVRLFCAMLSMCPIQAVMVPKSLPLKELVTSSPFHVHILGELTTATVQPVCSVQL